MVKIDVSQNNFKKMKKAIYLTVVVLVSGLAISACDATTEKDKEEEVNKEVLIDLPEDNQNETEVIVDSVEAQAQEEATPAEVEKEE